MQKPKKRGQSCYKPTGSMVASSLTKQLSRGAPLGSSVHALDLAAYASVRGSSGAGLVRAKMVPESGGESRARSKLAATRHMHTKRQAEATPATPGFGVLLESSVPGSLSPGLMDAWPALKGVSDGKEPRTGSWYPMQGGNPYNPRLCSRNTCVKNGVCIGNHAAL